MRIITPFITACVGTTQAFKAGGSFFSIGKDKKIFDQGLSDIQKNLFSSSSGGTSMDALLQAGRSNSGVLPEEEENEDQKALEEEANLLDTNGNYPHAVGQGMGAVAYGQRKASSPTNSKDKGDGSGILRSGRPSGNTEEVTINTPQLAIEDAHNNDVMILSSDYMYVSNCLLRRRHANDPIRQRAFDLFKQTAAGDWFIVFGYVCESDWSCWKKNVQNLLSKKGEEYGGGVIGRCVSRLVREKAEGTRARRRRRRRRDTRSVFDNSKLRL